jgi:hypothetical protein
MASSGTYQKMTSFPDMRSYRSGESETGVPSRTRDRANGSANWCAETARGGAWTAAATRHRRAHTACGLAMIVSLACAAGSVRADQIVVGQNNYARVEVLDFANGILTAREAGKERTFWIGDVDLIIVEGDQDLSDLNEAERYRHDGAIKQAVVRYRRAQRVAEGMWYALITTRLLQATDETGEIDQTVRAYIQVLEDERAGAAVAGAFLPLGIPEQRTREVVRAEEHLSNALRLATGDQRVMLLLCQYEIGQRTGNARAAEWAAAVAQRALPEAVQSDRAYEVLEHALRATLASSVTPAFWASLNEALERCPKQVMPRLLLLKGDALFARAADEDEVLQAGWAYMRVAIHFPQDERAPAALLGAARVMYRIGQPAKCRSLLAECLTYPNLDDKTRDLAHKLRDKVTSDGTSRP